MAAFVELVVVNEFGIGSLCPASRSLIGLIRKDTHGYSDGDVSHIEKPLPFLKKFPIETSRRNRRVSQPVVRNVVENIVW